MSTLIKRKTYKPIEFSWALQACKDQHRMHWTLDEINLSHDKDEYLNKLSDEERAIIKKVLLFFTQMDVEVAANYVEFLKLFKNPEIVMMLLAFASMETMHIMSYDAIPDILGFSHTVYEEFLEYKEMVNKYDYMQSFSTEEPVKLALTIAIVSGAIEGFVLYSSFAILNYFSTLRGDYSENCMYGMGQIITYSMRDESLHSISMIKLFHVFCAEQKIRVPQEDIHKHFAILADYEFKFIDLVFNIDGKEIQLPGLCKEDVKKYVKYLVNIRLKQLGYDILFEKIDKNPLPYMEIHSKIKERSNFFENTPTSYSKKVEYGDINEVFDNF